MWMKLLKEAVAASSKEKVAKKIGVSRTQVSLIVNNKYMADTRHFAKKFLDVYGLIQCPHLNAEITYATCRNSHTREAPTSNPREMKHWRACQTCPHNELNQGENHDE